MVNVQGQGKSPYDLLLSELKRIAGKGTRIQEKQILESFVPEIYNKGEYFIREGEIPQKLGFVVEGLMKYYYLDNNGNEWIKHFSAEKSFVSSYGSFLYQSPSLYFIEAVEPTSLLTISHQSFAGQIDHSMDWCTIARKYTEQIYYEKETREASFLKLDGKERYLEFLEKYSPLVNRISIKDMASFLGLNHVSLSRIRSSIRN